MRVDSRDTLVRHYCGERVANAMFRVMVRAVHASLLLSACGLLLVRSLLIQIVSRFDLTLLAAHLGMVSTGHAVVLFNPVAGCLWLLSASYIIVMLMWDAMPRKSRMSAVNYVLHCVTVVSMLAGMYFDEFKTRAVEFVLFNDIVSVNARVNSSVFTYAVFGLKFAFTALILSLNKLIDGSRASRFLTNEQTEGSRRLGRRWRQ